MIFEGEIRRCYPIDFDFADYDPVLQYNLQYFGDDGGDDKTEEPTPRKLEDARKDGQVAKSRELNSAFGLMALFVSLKLFVGSMGSEFIALFNTFYNRIPDVIDDSAGGFSIVTCNYFFDYCIYRIIIMCLPLYLIAIVIVVVVSIFQVGWKVSTKPMQPKLSKINPLSGFKRIISKDSLFELAKSIVKVVVIAIVAYLYIRDNFDFIFVLYDIPLMQAIGLFGNHAINLGIRISAIFLIIGVVDFIYEKRKFHKNMMMTKQEVKDEYKNTEGNPEAKNKQRQVMRQASMRRMMASVPQADVIITNPTHIAVALQYKPGEFTAPIVVAKGEDHLAERIKKVAAENDVEIVENKPLARMIYMNVEIGDMIPPELYQAVADVLAYVYKIKNKL